MSEMLTAMQRAELLKTLARFADRIDRVDVYGSRARGTHRPGSDVDLAIEGQLDLEDMLRIAVALEESHLSIFADVHRYSERLDPKFEAEVARDARLLFTKEQLLAAALARANEQADRAYLD